MLHYQNRKEMIHVLSMDPVLATDIYERIHTYPGFESVEIMVPGNKAAIAVDDIERLVPDTTKARVIIIDVRMETLARLRDVYNKVVRYNRADFNLFCNTVLIGHGPVGFLNGSRPLEGLQPYLVDLRNDYSPAVYFFDPFLHYTFDELGKIQYRNQLFPETIPSHLQDLFKESNPNVEQVRRYFRAADIPGDLREEKKKTRLRKLAKALTKKLEEEFPREKENLQKGLSKEGCALPGEALKLNIYPFFFEEWIADLMKEPKP